MTGKVLAMEGMISTLTLLCLVLSGVGALQVNIPEEIYEYARGDNVTLPCTFQPRSGSPPPLVVISWSLEGLQADAAETQILSYYSTGPILDIKKLYEGRVSVDVDIKTGKANLKLSSVTHADNNNFECRVQIPGDDEGKPYDTTRLVVLAAPSTPVCKINGEALYRENISLSCVSEVGIPSPTYIWESRDIRNMLRLPPPDSTDKGGILSLYNISRETSGYYTCISTNKVHSATCNIILTVMPPSKNSGSILAKPAAPDTKLVSVTLTLIVYFTLLVVL